MDKIQNEINELNLEATRVTIQGDLKPITSEQ